MTEIKYEIIRTNRKTLCVTVTDGKVIVRSPMRLPIEKIERFVQSKSSWIIKRLNENTSLDELVSLKKIYVKGRLVPLIVGKENFVTLNCVCVSSVKNLKKLYVATFGEEFINLFNEISNVSGLRAKSIGFKSYKSRWGCCDSKRAIIFNYKLLMLPVDLWRCVIVHELCHTVFMDHSKNFHALAQSVMPSYNRVHKRLKEFACVCRLYQ